MTPCLSLVACSLRLFAISTLVEIFTDKPSVLFGGRNRINFYVTGLFGHSSPIRLLVLIAVNQYPLISYIACIFKFNVPEIK